MLPIIPLFIITQTTVIIFSKLTIHSGSKALIIVDINMYFKYPF